MTEPVVTTHRVVEDRRRYGREYMRRRREDPAYREAARLYAAERRKIPQVKARHKEEERRRTASGKKKEQERRWRAANPVKVAAKNARRRAHYATKGRDWTLRYHYGITLADEQALIIRQGGGCAICHSKFKRAKFRHVDHDHTTGVVRGVLCHLCNKGLGLYHDDPTLLRAAAAYLEARR